MPLVSERKTPNMSDFSKNPMYEYASKFYDVQKNILNESKIDYAFEPAKATTFPSVQNSLKKFFVEGSFIGDASADPEAYQDNMNMMNEAFINDIQAVRENAVAGMNNYNPMIGLSLPMHKYLMMNCVFAQAVPRFVAKAPAWTETMETRYMVTPDGTRIDIANEQNKIFGAWKSANKPVEVAIALPEKNQVDILGTYFKTSKELHNLSVATHISAIAVEDYVHTGDPIVKINTGKSPAEVTEAVAESDGVNLVWKPWKAEFNPGYGEANRIIVQPVDIIVTDADGTTEKEFHDTIFASQTRNMFEINAASIKAVKMFARFDASSRTLKTNRVEWAERSTYVQIPENDGITVPVTPEEVKDIGALYGINQVTKYMSIIKDILVNVKDDDIKEHLDESFMRLDDDHKLARTYDMAPPQNYLNTYVEWNKSVFMNQLDNFVTGLLTVLRDPNMQICVIGRPGIIRNLTPVEYTYTTPSSVGPVELDFHKTVVTSDKRVYNFISSDKLWGNDELMVLLIPKNTNRIVYRLYDYQMYISNEIRDAQNPSLPALTAFQRYKFFGFQEVQGRIMIANPGGLREYLPNVNPKDKMYNNNDLSSVMSAYNKETGQNEAKENRL